MDIKNLSIPMYKDIQYLSSVQPTKVGKFKINTIV